MGGVAKEVRGDLAVKGKLIITGSIENESGAPLLEASSAKPSRMARFSISGTVSDETAALTAIMGATGTLKAVYASCGTACLGDSTITVDIKQGNSGEAATTVLSSVITLDSGDDDREMVAGTLSVTALNLKDVIEVVIDATVGTGTLGADLLVVLVYDEEYPT